MFWVGLQFVAAACVGFLATEAGRVIHQSSTNTTARRRELILALRYRGVVLGAILGGGPVMMSWLSSEAFSLMFCIACLGASLAVTLVGSVAWLHLVRNHGQRDIESVETALVLAILPLAFLYVCGLLWITIGVVLVVAAGVCGGLYYYRARIRARAR